MPRNYGHAIIRLFTCLSCLLHHVQGVGAPYGAVDLFNYTFDKIVSAPGLTVLVKFDYAYPYGEKAAAFEELCRLASSVEGFLLATVPIKSFADRDNEDLRARFNVDPNDFPEYFLFNGSAEMKAKFEGFPDVDAKKPHNWRDAAGEWKPPLKKEITVDKLTRWLRIHGIHLSTTGTIGALDDVAWRFMNNGFEESDVVEMKQLVELQYHSDRRSTLYLNVMKKIKQIGVSYIETELARIKKIQDHVSEGKQAELADKVKVLKIFSEYPGRPAALAPAPKKKAHGHHGHAQAIASLFS